VTNRSVDKAAIALPASIAGIALIVLVVLLAGTKAKATNPALGRYLSSECVTCHQISGAQTEGIPPIVGWPRTAFIAVMKSYRAKERDSTVMQTIASRLSDDEIMALAIYFETIEKK
jgi:cytochrome c